MADIQPQAIDKTATPSLSGGHPYQNLKSVDVTSAKEGESLFTSTTSTVEVTISGRVVFRPIRKAGA